MFSAAEMTATAVATKPTVFIVDDDRQVRESLSLLVSSAGMNVEAFGSAEEFLEHYNDDSDTPQCLILDVRMPGMSGLGLQEKLALEKIRIPIVIISGYANVAMAVQAMRAGAVDFLEKPFHRQALLERVQQAIDRHAEIRWQQARQGDVASRMALLSSREREVMHLLVAAKNAKEIASNLGISAKTVATHRARVLEKMRVESVVELARLFVGSEH